MTSSTRRAFVALIAALGLLLGACGSDDDTGGTDDAADSGGPGTNAITVTVSMDGIDVPDEIEGGIVEVTFETVNEGGDFSFSKVAAGTTEEQFRNGIVGAVSGRGIPDFVEASAGVAGESGSTTTLTLPEGNYFVWSIPEPPEEEGGEEEGEDEAAADAPEAEQPGEAEGEGGPEGGGGPPPEAVVLKAVKVTPGDAGNLPDPGDQITAKDYSFDIDVQDGADEVLFRNDGPNEYHHAVLFNFGDIEASVVEENFEAFINSGGPEDAPEALAKVDPEKLEAGNTGVFSPNLGGTSALKIEAGNTYAVACFIGDKAGGPPHAIAHKMWKVFAA